MNEPNGSTFAQIMSRLNKYLFLYNINLFEW